MKFGISLPPFGDYGDPRKLAAMAKVAEDMGWDGFFIWDHIIFDPTFHPIADPWVALAAIALNTSRIHIGTMVTPLARRRPWKVARETVGVDLLSNGRLTLGIGLGDPAQWDYGFFGEEQDVKTRAAKVDEGLDILTGLWSGKAFSYQGKHYTLAEMIFQPVPVQSPRIPIWVGGNWDKLGPKKRAARWDGYFPLKWGADPLTPADWRKMIAELNPFRVVNSPFDWIHGGQTPGDDPAKATDLVAPFAEVGVTWWMESVDPWRWGWKWEDPLTPEATRLMDDRIRQGPPRLP